MEILILVVLILLNGVFAMSEIALVTARRGQLVRLAEAGDRSAAVAVTLSEAPTRFLSTVQVGITSIGILSGIFGEAALAVPLSLWLQNLGVEPRVSSIASTTLVVAAITYVAIVVGELVPKRVGQLHPERIARWVARPISILSTAVRPFVYLLAGSTPVLLRVLGQRDSDKPSITEEEIYAVLHEGSEAGVIEKSEHTMVRNVLRLDERHIGSLMVPVSDLEWLDIERPLDELMSLISRSSHSRFPVCRGGLNDILGVVSAKQLLGKLLQGAPLDLTAELESPVFVPEFLSGMEVLYHFRINKSRMVFVVDEYGEIDGIVSLHDVLESVAGEFYSGSVEEAWAFQREDGSWLLDGLMPIPELADCLNLSSVPGGDKVRYHTLSGLMLWLLERLPRTGDSAIWEQWRFEVVDLDGKRIDKVLASLVKESPDARLDDGSGF